MNFAKLADAVNFAALKHRDQRRKDRSASPYINHPIEVVDFLCKAGVEDVEILMAGCLHDTVEDTNTTLEEIELRFGPRVALMVSQVSDDKSLPKEVRKQQQIEHIANATEGAKLIKLADKLSNCSGLLTDPPTSWSPQVIQGYAYWSLAVVKQVRGLNAWFDAQFDSLFAEQGIGASSDEELQERLQTYYAMIKGSD